MDDAPLEEPGMKILMVAPLSIGIVHGGVRMQSLKTAEHLQKLGVTIDFYNPWDETDPESYDLIHIFLAANETLAIANRLGERNCRVAVSPVFFTRRSASIVRQTINAESIGSKLFKGIFSDYSIKASVCKAADIVLPNTSAEADLIHDGFGIPREKIAVIPNGVDGHFKDATPDLFNGTYNVRNFTLFVGDASAPRKNILNLLQEHTELDHPLVIIGKLDESDYSKQCLKIINSRENIHFLGPMDHDDSMLPSAYAAADVFTLPSQFETPGIAALEAALAGCRIAITEVGGTKEVFGEHGHYIDPEKKGSIMQAIRSAHEASSGSDNGLRDRLLKEYTWERVAEKTLKAYQKMLSIPTNS